ncbi:hypothetical protein ES703_94807 [subsurface metagenome]
MSGTIDLPEGARAKIDAMLKAEEDQLYAWLGEALAAEDANAYLGDLQAAATESLNFMTHKVYSIEGGRGRPAATFIPLKPLIEKGKKFIKKNTKKLHQKICVDMNACKWEKDILGDSKQLFSLLLPAVNSALKVTIPAAALTVIIMMKWGIRLFCDCAKKDDN